LHDLDGRFIVYTYEKDPFLASGQSTSNISDWLSLKSAEMKVLRKFPISINDIPYLPKFFGGHNILGYIYMALQESLKTKQAEDMIVKIQSLDGHRYRVQPINDYRTPIPQKRRIQFSESNSESARRRFSSLSKPPLKSRINLGVPKRSKSHQKSFFAKSSIYNRSDYAMEFFSRYSPGKPSLTGLTEDPSNKDTKSFFNHSSVYNRSKYSVIMIESSDEFEEEWFENYVRESIPIEAFFEEDPTIKQGKSVKLENAIEDVPNLPQLDAKHFDAQTIKAERTSYE